MDGSYYDYDYDYDYDFYDYDSYDSYDYSYYDSYTSWRVQKLPRRSAFPRHPAR